MSYQSLRDWAVGDKIRARHLQDMTEGIRSERTFYFGNVFVRGVGRFGKAVYIPPPPPVPNPPVHVKITDSESGGGKYAGYILRPPTTVATASGDLTEAEIGVVTDAQNCLILNTREVGKSTHDLSSSGFLPLVFPGRIVGSTAEGKPIVVIDGYQWEDDCP